jgi:phosphoglycerate dehydrogenase-like enzyme
MAITSTIVAHGDFEAHWPFVVDRMVERWHSQGTVCVVRLAKGDKRTLGEVLEQSADVTQLIVLGVPFSDRCLRQFEGLREAAFQPMYGKTACSDEQLAELRARGVEVYMQPTEGFWGESVAEFALALTLCGLRQIPQLYHEMMSSHEAWERYRPQRNEGPGKTGAQFSDNIRFTNGTVRGKRVRIVGAGNIASRYASFVHLMGAEVAAWDPFATDPSFHRSGSRKVWRLEELVRDAEIFAPMLPLTESTRNVVDEDLIRALPVGCLVVLATRATICHVPTLRERVVAGELALAADVFDVEPLPLDDPLLGLGHVVHTPHVAGRTRDANWQWAEDLLAQFRTPA